MYVSHSNKKSHFKTLLVKYTALIMGVCYLANPMQQQISSVFHEISHFFEMPDTVIDHRTPGVSSETTHRYHEHKHSFDEHEHELIDFLVSILNDSAEDDKEEPLLTKFKYDKHIKTDQYPEEKIYDTDKKSSLFSNEYSTIKTYSRVLKEPPKIFSV